MNFTEITMRDVRPLLVNSFEPLFDSVNIFAFVVKINEDAGL